MSHRALAYLLFFCQTFAITAHATVPGDFDGDGISDLVVWRPAEGNWYVYPSTWTVNHQCPPCFQPYNPAFGGCVQQWGLPGDTPREGDFDADGKMDVAVWRPSTKTWWIKGSNNCGVWQVPLGPTILATDIPDVAEVTGDGRSDIMMLRRGADQQDSYWFVRDSSTAVVTQYTAGNPEFRPQQAPFVTLSGHYDPFIPTAEGVFSETYDAGGTLYYKLQRTAFGGGGYGSTTTIFSYNDSHHVTTRGDWGGAAANLLDYTFFDTTNGMWNSSFNYGGGLNGSTSISWGLSGDKPISGDFNRDGIADPAVWRPAEGRWYIDIPSNPCPPAMLPTGGSMGCYQNWGLSGDVPVEALLDMSISHN